jgi:hypothetical protein
MYFSTIGSLIVEERCYQINKSLVITTYDKRESKTAMDSIIEANK